MQDYSNKTNNIENAKISRVPFPKWFPKKLQQAINMLT